MKPLQIYLDSSDFSDLGNLDKKSAEFTEVRNYLIKMRDKGHIAFYFSDTHVIEAAPTSPAAIPNAMDRFRTIKAICDKNCVLHPIDVVKSEVAHYAGVANEPLEVTKKDGVWMPKFYDLSEILLDVEKSSMQDIEQLGRAGRRKYLKNGKITPLWYEEMRQANVRPAQVEANQLPLSATAVRSIQRYFIGQASRKDALAALHASLSDLEVFGNWYASNWSSASAMSEYLREIGKNFQTVMYEARSKFESLLQECSEKGVEKSVVLDQSTQSFHEVLASAAHNILAAMDDNMEVPSKLTGYPWRDAPGLTCSVSLAMHVARRTVSSPKPRAPKSSDFPDCYHALYLPYFDIFRADSFTASVVREAKFPCKTTIVDKFLELPLAIDKMLAERA